MNRTALYLAANLLFLVAVGVGALSGPANGVHPLYLVALFALCSSPILVIRRLNDRYILLGIFSAVYFLFFGVLDFFNLMSGTTQPDGHDDIVNNTELVILIGGALAFAGYRLACQGNRATPPGTAKDWPESTLVFAGGLLWIVSTWLTWQFKVYVIVDTSIDNQHRGLAGAGAGMSAVYMLATYLQPLGMLILAYAQSKYRRFYMLPVLIVAVLVQLLMGFVVDIKGDALLGLIIVLLTKLLVDGRIPGRWLLAGALFVMVAWPVLQANRTVRDQYSMNHAEVARNLLTTVERALEAKKEVMKGPDRANTIFERMSLKGSVDMIVSGTERGVRFQDGYTLTPLVTAFIPRLVWRDKPDVQTGLLLNKVFQVSEVEDTYISPSHLGELYWNFGWAGVTLGMFAIGLLFGFLGSRFDLSATATLTRVMIAVVTMRAIVLGFEGAIAPQYVVWMRSMLAVGLLHLVLARSVKPASADSTSSAEARRVPPDPARRIANLMR
ncbi:MAG: hypothetical protein P4L83_12170 [Nevskia sp.]|nr:hypothetical protein [Nevskia sp.]